MYTLTEVYNFGKFLPNYLHTLDMIYYALREGFEINYEYFAIM